MKQTIIWTALPNGVALDKNKRYLQLSVVVSPKLVTNPGATKLEPFDFFEWPKTALEFAVEFPNGQKIPAERVQPLPEIALWQALFTKDTYVEPYELEDFALRPIRSYQVKPIMDFLKKKYLEVAVKPELFTKRPTPEDIKKTFDQVVSIKEKAPLIEAHINSILSERGVIAPPETGKIKIAALNSQLSESAHAKNITPTEIDFMQLKLFHQPPKIGPVQQQEIKLDFHGVVTMLNNYPEIASRLGLIINLRLPLDSNLEKTLAGISRLRVLPTWQSAPKIKPVEHCPWVHYEFKVASQFQQSVFQTRPRPVSPELKDGKLIVTNPKSPAKDPCHVEQVDVDGLALKVMDPGNTSMPAMRTAGISLVRNGYADIVMKKIKDMAAKYAALPPGGIASGNNKEMELYAEDVVRGYRIDVWDGAANKWYSLCQRKGIYKFLDPGITEDITDEGFVQLGVTQAADGSSKDLYLHEALFRWDGWSLCVQRPGKAIRPDDERAEVFSKAGKDFRLETSFTVPKGTLPRLRFGITYKLRVRAVDLAGNSVALSQDPGDPATVTRPFRYTRFEPISAPVVIQHNAPQQGESIERLAVRSNYNTPINKLKPPTGERYIAPPPTSQQMAETHGKFDTVSGLDKAAYKVIAGREGTYDDPGGKEQLAKMKLPYLPDPLAFGATFTGLPGQKTGSVTQVPFGSSNNWLNTRPFILQVEGTEADSNPAQPQFDTSRRVLTVQLPKAATAKVRLSSYPEQTHMRSIGVWQWLEEAKPSNLNTIRQVVLQKEHRLLKPTREITLVHAVQQPLIEPSFVSFEVDKQKIGDTYAHMYLKKKMPISGKSTVKLDIWAEWHEYIDDLRQAEPEKRKVKAHVMELPVQDGVNDIMFSSKRHEFSDTKFRNVTYTPVAVSRFGDYFPPGTDLTRKGSPTQGHSVNNSARPDAPKVLYVIPTFGWQDLPGSGSGTMGRRRSGGGLRVYLERPWYSSGEGEKLAVLLRAAADPNKENDPLKPYVTQWGKDPIWAANPTDDILTAKHFKKGKNFGSGYSLAELPSMGVSVVAHEVFYDKERKLWYCDIEINPGQSYYPFVRLALARFQPNSLPGAHLSRVVQADFAQLAPERQAFVINVDSKTVTVMLQGPTYSKSGTGSGSSTAIVTVETRQNAAAGELGWVPAGEFNLHRNEAANAWSGKELAMPAWYGSVTLPAERGSRQMRLVFKEYEWFKDDTDREARLVYADIFNI